MHSRMQHHISVHHSGEHATRSNPEVIIWPNTIAMKWARCSLIYISSITTFPLKAWWPSGHRDISLTNITSSPPPTAARSKPGKSQKKLIDRLAVAVPGHPHSGQRFRKTGRFRVTGHIQTRVKKTHNRKKQLELEELIGCFRGPPHKTPGVAGTNPENPRPVEGCANPTRKPCPT